MAADYSKEYLTKLLIGLCIFLALVLIGSIASMVLRRLGGKFEKDKRELFNLFGKISNVGFCAVGLTSFLGTIGIDVSAVIAGMGLTGFALGFAVKDAISNLLSGILIIFYHTFKPGDKISVVGCDGVVTEINLRYTKIENGDDAYIIPNSIIFNNWVKLMAPPKPPQPQSHLGLEPR